MKTTELTREQRTVYGNNLINKLSIEAVKKILPQLEKFVGKKVMTVKQEKTSKFVVELLKVPYNDENGESYRSYLTFRYNKLVLFNDVTVKDVSYSSGGYGCTYYQREIDLGELCEGGTLSKIYDFDSICEREGLNKSFDAAEQKKIKEQISELEQQIRVLKSKLC